MSLLRRVERAQQAAELAQQAAEGQVPRQMVPVMAPTPPSPPTPPRPEPRLHPGPGQRGPTRDELIREIRMKLQGEVISAFDTLLDAKPAEVRQKIEGIVDRTIDAQGFAVTRDERTRLIDEMSNDVTGFGPLEPLLHDETITEVMVNGPRNIYIERDGKIQRVETAFLNDERWS